MRSLASANQAQRSRYHFCPTCGATVHYALEREPELVAIPVGAFGDPDFPPPDRSIYERRMHTWVALRANVEHAD